MKNGRKRTRFLTIDGETKSVVQWAVESGIEESTIYWRIKKGKTGKELIKRIKKSDNKTNKEIAINELWHGKWVYVGK